VKGLFYEFLILIPTPNRITGEPARHGFHVRMIEDEGRDVCWFVATPVPGAEDQAA
jgi:hypothetical protein